MFGELCVRCKGRLWCGLPKCPILEAAKNYMPRLKINPNDIFGLSPPSIFVGRFGYPNVLAGPLVSQSEESSAISDTSNLYGKDLDFVMKNTSSLLRASIKVNVKKPYGKIIDATQEISMSIKPLDTEVKVEKIRMSPSLDTFFHPTGPLIIPRKIDVVDNPAIPRKVDSVVEERLKANKVIIELYNYGLSVDYIQRILSAGVLGFDKKLVPTRWSITAVDDAIGKYLLKKIRNYKSINEIQYYSNSFMGNEFHILLIPGAWEFEMLESWLKGSLYSPRDTVIGEDYEPYTGRKNYAENITGAYYAARLAVAEHLESIRRQARVIIYREITPDYKLPLGVWVIRETVRHAMFGSPKKFDDIDSAIEYISKKVKIGEWKNRSRIIYGFKHQKTLFDFQI